MIRKRLSLIALSLIAALAIGGSAEAAGKKIVRHRTRHSSRVTSGAATSSTNTAKKSKGTKGTKGTKKQASKSKSRKPATTKKQPPKPATKP